MKSMIYNALNFDPEISLAVSGRIYGGSSLGQGEGGSGSPVIPKRPFIIYNLGPSSPYFVVRDSSRAAAQNVDVYVYENIGSYKEINQILPLVREALVSLAGQVSPSGSYRCLDVVWTGYSQETQDDELVSNMRFASFEFRGTDA